MTSKYWLLMKSVDGRVIRSDSFDIIHDGPQSEADCEAMKSFGERLIKIAEVERKLRAEAA